MEFLVLNFLQKETSSLHTLWEHDLVKQDSM